MDVFVEQCSFEVSDLRRPKGLGEVFVEPISQRKASDRCPQVRAAISIFTKRLAAGMAAFALDGTFKLIEPFADVLVHRLADIHHALVNDTRLDRLRIGTRDHIDTGQPSGFEVAVLGKRNPF